MYIEWLRSKATLSSLSLRERAGVRVIECRFTSTWLYNHLKQAEAAEILMVSRPRVSDLMNKKVSKFTINALLNMLSSVGKPVRLAVG